MQNHVVFYGHHILMTLTFLLGFGCPISHSKIDAMIVSGPTKNPSYTVCLAQIFWKEQYTEELHLYPRQW